MSKQRIHMVLAALISISGIAGAEESESGRLGMYPPQFQGRTTASGEIYDGKTLTAAHDALPIGTFLRVANFETGKMLDVRINDRKADDGTLLTLSEAAGRKLGISPGQTPTGSLMVLKALPASPKRPNLPSTPPSFPSLFSKADQPAQAVQAAPSEKKGFRPFAGFGRKDPLYDAVRNPNAPVRETAAPVAPPARPQLPKWDLFSGNRKVESPSLPPSATYQVGMAPRGSGGSLPASPAPQPSVRELIPMSAPGGPSRVDAIPPPGVAVGSAGAGLPRSAVPVVAPVASPATPYRVQFGAFRRQANAMELSGMLVRAGIGTTVVPSAANGLHLVVTSGGFSTAEQAQQWIDYEGSRRGWRDRPVVIR